MLVEVRTTRDGTELIVERDCDACGNPIEFTLAIDGGVWGGPAWHVRTIVSHLCMVMVTWSEAMTLHGELQRGGPQWVTLRAKMDVSLTHVLWESGCWDG